MQSGSYWAFREAAELPDRDYDEPVVKVLWNKEHVARRPHLCGICHEEIAPGTRYRSSGYIIDGEFSADKTHLPNCPRFAALERTELAAQFEADREQFFPAGPGAQAAGPATGSSHRLDEPLLSKGGGESPR